MGERLSLGGFDQRVISEVREEIEKGWENRMWTKQHEEVERELRAMKVVERRVETMDRWIIKDTKENLRYMEWRRREEINSVGRLGGMTSGAENERAELVRGRRSCWYKVMQWEEGFEYKGRELVDERQLLKVRGCRGVS